MLPAHPFDKISFEIGVDHKEMVRRGLTPPNDLMVQIYLPLDTLNQEDRKILAEAMWYEDEAHQLCPVVCNETYHADRNPGDPLCTCDFNTNEYHISVAWYGYKPGVIVLWDLTPDGIMRDLRARRIEAIKYFEKLKVYHLEDEATLIARQKEYDRCMKHLNSELDRRSYADLHKIFRIPKDFLPARP